MSPEGERSAFGIVAAAIETELARPRSGPIVIGLCGAQGSGKSTVTGQIVEHFRSRSLAAAAFSLDDLYLPLQDRIRLARDVHPLLRVRGVPGTHDVALGCATIDSLAGPGRTMVPRFDKSIDDRAPAATWETVTGPVDLIILEGWCVGARPQSPDALGRPVNDLEEEEDPDGTWRRYVNDALASSYQDLFSRIDLLVMLAAPGFEVVEAWRTQQEEELRRKAPDGAAVMDAPALRRFLKFYERLTRHMLEEMPGRADLVVRLDNQRRIISVSPSDGSSGG